MGFFNEANEDAFSVTPDAAATGPRVGFLDAFETSYGHQVRGAAMYGIESAMWDLDDKQVKAMRQAGIENVPALSPDSMGWFNENLPGVASGVDKYVDTARFYTDGGDPAFATQLEDYDKRVDELRKQYPELDLKTSREMWGETKAAAQEYERRAYGERHTIGGAVGAFLGGAVGSVNPNTDPLNFLTLGVGGAGKTVVGRVASQVGAQGVIETINQVTGVQEERRLLGLDHGFVDGAGRVLETAIGAGALQGIGEGLAFGYRRWFRSAPNDLAPDAGADLVQRPNLPDTTLVPPQAIPADEALAASKLVQQPDTFMNYVHEQSILSNSRSGRARTVIDLDYVATRLDDWNGPRPWELPPKTDTASTRPAGDFVAPDFQSIAQGATVDELARRVDPDVFRKYDRLADRVATYRRWLDELADTRDQNLHAKMQEFDDRIYQLEGKAAAQTGKRAAKTRKEIPQVEREREQYLAENAGTETGDLRRVRETLMKEDTQMRDMAPEVSRAYARARQSWDNTEQGRKAILDAMREGKKEIDLPERNDVIEAVEMALSDKAPILQGRNTLTKPLPKDADAADVANAVLAETAKVIDEAVEQYRASVDGLLAVEKNGEISVDGRTYKLNLDKDTVFVPNEDGTGSRQLTVRQLLEENKMDEYELEAVTTCSTRKTS